MPRSNARTKPTLFNRIAATGKKMRPNVAAAFEWILMEWAATTSANAQNLIKFYANNAMTKNKQNSLKSIKYKKGRTHSRLSSKTWRKLKCSSPGLMTWMITWHLSPKHSWQRSTQWSKTCLKPKPSFWSFSLHTKMFRWCQWDSSCWATSSCGLLLSLERIDSPTESILP